MFVLPPHSPINFKLLQLQACNLAFFFYDLITLNNKLKTNECCNTHLFFKLNENNYFS